MSNKPKQVAILGLGIFGCTLAETLEDFGVEVLAVDIDPVCVGRIKDNVTKAIVADVTDREQLLELDINTFDVAVVAISKHFEEAVSCTLLLKELNVPYVIAKARTKRKKIILEKVGADRVINTEKEMAYKLAKHLLRRSIVDLVELDEETFSTCKKKIEKLNEELKNAKSTIKDIDNAIKELKILLEYCSQDNEERNK